MDCLHIWRPQPVLMPSWLLVHAYLTAPMNSSYERLAVCGGVDNKGSLLLSSAFAV
jgi:hypothetical protein